MAGDSRGERVPGPRPTSVNGGDASRRISYAASHEAGNGGMPSADDEWFMRSFCARIRVTRDDRGRASRLDITWGGVGEPMKFSRVEPAETAGG